PISRIRGGLAMGLFGTTRFPSGFGRWLSHSRAAGISSRNDPTTIQFRRAVLTWPTARRSKAIAISREGSGTSIGAKDTEIAKREALDRCRQRDQKGTAGLTHWATGSSGRNVWFPRRLTCTTTFEPALMADDGMRIN